MRKIEKKLTSWNWAEFVHMGLLNLKKNTTDNRDAASSVVGGSAFVRIVFFSFFKKKILRTITFKKMFQTAVIPLKFQKEGIENYPLEIFLQLRAQSI